LVNRKLEISTYDGDNNNKLDLVFLRN